jgi:hypothetical protein
MKTTLQYLTRLIALLSLLAASALAQEAQKPVPPETPSSGQVADSAQKKADEEKAKNEQKAKEQLRKEALKKELEQDGIKQAEERLKAARKELAKALEKPASVEQAKLVKEANKKVHAAEKSWSRKLSETAQAERRRLVTTTMLSILAIILVGGVVWTFGPKIRAMLGWKAKDKTTAEEEAYLRGALARSVMGYAFLFVTLIVVVVLGGGIVNAVKKDLKPESATLFFDMSKYVLGVLLPVVAAWVGTVMAFYFGRENFQAASKSVQEMARLSTSKDKLDSQTVDKLGLDITVAATYTLAAGAALTSVTLDTLTAAFTKGGKTYERLPVLKDDGSPLCCLHSSSLREYELEKRKAAAALNPPALPPAANLTLQALLAAKPELLTESFATLPKTCKGTDAQSMIGDFCKDVFITDTGTARSKVLFWITNLDLLKASQV